MKKKFFSLILVFLMAFSVLPGISVNAEGAALTGITTTVGSISPAFNADTLYYKIELENLDTMPTINATAAEGYTVTVEQPSAVNQYVSGITVTNNSDSSDTKTYYVRLVPTTGERIVPVTAVAKLSSDTNTKITGSSLAEAIDANPDSVETSGHVMDYYWQSVYPGEGNKAYFTLDLGRVMDVTRVYFRAGSDNNSMKRISNLYVSNDGVNFKTLCTSTDGSTYTCNEGITRTATTLVRGDIYGMGGRYVEWTFSSPIEARYIKVENYDTANKALIISYTTVYARTFADTPSLEELTIDRSTLSPAFSPDVYDYTVEVDDLSSLPVISATAPEGYTAAETQMSAENNYVGRVRVSNSNDALDEKVYTVRALSKEHNAMLPITCQERGCDAAASSFYSLDGGIDLSNPATLYFSSNGKSSDNSYANEYNPYYTVDLGRLAEISMVRFNQRTNTHTDRAAQKGDSNEASVAYFEKLEVSTDGINFTDVTVTPTAGIGSDNIYGLAYYQISFDLESSPVVARYIRVSNDDAKSLWIRGTEVFGKLLGDGITHSLDDAKATATYKVQDGHDDARIILALYKIVEDGIDNTPDATLNFVDVKMSDAATNGIVTAEYTIPDGKTDEYVVKAFVLDSMGTIVPLAPSRGI